MSLANEIANDIWESEGFKEDIASLLIANIHAELNDNGLIEPIKTLDIDVVSRLLQAALIFADCDVFAYREAAQKISTAIFRLIGEGNDPISDIFTSIQGRLKNFPLLLQGKSEIAAPRLAPLALQLELISALKEQTIVVNSDNTCVFSPFQLESWTALTNNLPVALSGPTSAGKSYVLLQYVIERLRISAEGVVVYVVPTRALINQVAADIENEVSSKGIDNVIVSTVPVDIGLDTNNKLFYILTQERLEVLLINRPNVNIELIVIDEAQKIESGSRGILLESVIDRVFEASPSAQIVFCGPMISNPKYFGRLFNLENFQECSTLQSPVTQNIIHLDCLEDSGSTINVRLSLNTELTNVAKIPISIRLKTDLDKISYLSFLFGRSGSSIVYASGKAEAEKIAVKVAQEMNPPSNQNSRIEELIAFVKKHVHKDYALVETLKKGVAFHYGHMPSLLRKELENSFKSRHLSYLVCTSTLLYGLNLPAKNIFLLKPTTGRESPISSPDFWNLAGRAGRLGKELEGYVYLIDYSRWPERPLDGNREVTIKSALQTAIADNSEEFLEPREKSRQNSLLF
jgi:replicative superfamily II helicase